MAYDRIASHRPSALSRELDCLHRGEVKLLHEEDLLVEQIRDSGLRSNPLSARTRLSRQALMKRMPPPR